MRPGSTRVEPCHTYHLEYRANGSIRVLKRHSEQVRHYSPFKARIIQTKKRKILRGEALQQEGTDLREKFNLLFKLLKKIMT